MTSSSSLRNVDNFMTHHNRFTRQLRKPVTTVMSPDRHRLKKKKIVSETRQT